MSTSFFPLVMISVVRHNGNICKYFLTDLNGAFKEKPCKVIDPFEIISRSTRYVVIILFNVAVTKQCDLFADLALHRKINSIYI